MAAVSRQKVTCRNRSSKCFLKPITCPYECPQVKPTDPKMKGCFLDCDSPKCEVVCRNRKPNCNSPGAACFDPRFIGGDGIIFYFHGKSKEHFSLISDQNLQINARFIGHRPTGRTRDYTWIQALGLMFGSHTFSVEAKKVEKWNDEVDQLQFSYDGKSIEITDRHLSEWKSPKEELKVERTSNKNSVTVNLIDFAEILINVVPITEQDDKIHNYQIPSDDCFAHLEVQFRFIGLSPEVEGVLGRTYRPDFVNPAKPGVAMAVVGGEDKYRTSSLLSSDCSSCMFSPAGVDTKENSLVMDYGTLDCGRWGNGGNGIVCRK
ncbi:Root cap [Thalictrum thalictroides]|uniref:Root cap n=1 Tax=Thalictrum thalictroides TaxID=46969 RepID=A0A7J6WYZ1_THATH|nr:Root cap [Thalictrum thalictroides]